MDRSKKYLVSGITTIVLAAGIFSYLIFDKSEQARSEDVKDIVVENTLAAKLPSYVKYLIESGLITADENIFTQTRNDSDFDGLNNLQEFLYGTDPRDANSDDDELSDADEVLVYGSSPLSWDSDGDKISDSKEKAGEIWQFNLLNFESSDSSDADLDGISDVQEKVFGSDARNEDTDSDGLNDGEEILIYDTNPLEKSPHYFFKIANFKSGQISSSGEQFITGSGRPNQLVEIYIIKETKETLMIAQSTTDEFGKFALWTKALEPGTYFMSALFKEKKEVLGFSYPLKVEFKEKSLVEAPLLKDISTIGTGKIPVFNIQTLSPNTSIMAFWHGIGFMNSILSGTANETLSFKPDFVLQPGEQELTLYALSNENNSMSKAQRVSFKVDAPIRGLRFKENKAALFWAGVLLGSILFVLTKREALRISASRATYNVRKAGI